MKKIETQAKLQISYKKKCSINLIGEGGLLLLHCSKGGSARKRLGNMGLYIQMLINAPLLN